MIDIERLRGCLLSMVKEFHRVCVENNLVYYIAGGTLLGAYRHKGFIPWDDDMDIVMPRSDYDTFLKLSTSVLPNNLEVRNYTNTEKSPFHFIKLIDKNTTLIEKFYTDYVEGVYIDVFPLDGMGKNSYADKLKCRKIWKLHTMIIRHCSTDAGISTVDNIKNTISKAMSLKLLHRMVENEVQSIDYDASEYVINYFGAWGAKEIMPKVYFGTPKLVDFEDIQLFAPENVHDYLSSLYGDYMKLPPKEQQVLRHSYHYLDFDMPYSEYLKKNNI